MKQIFFILCIAVNCIYSQEYSGFAYEMFFGRQPSARVEALGKGLITIEDGANSSFYNPSLIGQTKGLNFSYSHSDPYYSYNDASYQYFGISYKTGIHAFAINKFSLDYKFLDEYLTKSIYKLNYAIAPKEGFSAGVNINYYSFYGEPNYEGFMFDVGALKEFKLEESPSSLQKLNTAFVFKNVLRKTIEIDDNLIEFPSTFEIGVSYSGKFKGEFPFYGLDFLNTFFNIEYRELIGSVGRSMFIVGTELKFLEVLALRAGYFRETKIVIDYSIKDSYTDFTYGFGLAFPLYKLTQGIPLEIKLDFMSKEQPSFIKDVDNWNNMTIYNLMVNWVL